MGALEAPPAAGATAARAINKAVCRLLPQSGRAESEEPERSCTAEELPLAAELSAHAAMTLEEFHGQHALPTDHDWMQGASKALHELLVSAQRRGCLTAGVYESAKLMNVDPDNVAFCVLAADEEDEGDIALQIHFTLIQAFCCENDIDIVRVNDLAKLADIVGPSEDSGEPRDLHCILIMNPSEEGWKDPALEKLNSFCEASRNVNDWVPTVPLPE